MSSSVDTYERRVEVTPAWDDGPGQGAGSALIGFTLIGARSAVSLFVTTFWTREVAEAESWRDGPIPRPRTDVTTHLFCPPVRLVGARECCYSPTGHCVTESPAHWIGDGLLRALILEGDEGLWRELEALLATTEDRSPI